MKHETKYQRKSAQNCLCQRGLVADRIDTARLFHIFDFFVIDIVSSISFSCLCLHPRFSRTDLLSEKSSHWRCTASTMSTVVNGTDKLKKREVNNILLLAIFIWCLKEYLTTLLTFSFSRTAGSSLVFNSCSYWLYAISWYCESQMRSITDSRRGFFKYVFFFLCNPSCQLSMLTKPRQVRHRRLYEIHCLSF